MRLILLTLFITQLYINTSNAANSNDCISVNDIKVNSNVKISTKRLDEILFKFKNTCITVNVIDLIIKDLTNYFADQGYITVNFSVPEQDLTSRKLVINSDVSVVESIEYEDDIQKSFDPVFLSHIGSAVNLRDIEQAYETLNSIRSNNATLELIPGSENHKSKILVKNKKNKHLYLKTSLDNNGDSSKGRYNSNITAGYDDFLGLNESFFYNASKNLADKDEYRNLNNSFYWSMPYGYNKISFNYDFGFHKKYLKASEQLISYNGRSNRGGINLTRTILRDKERKVLISLGFRKSNFREYIDDIKLENQSHKLSVIEFGLNHYTSLYNGSFTNGITLEKGLTADSTKVDYNNKLSPIPNFSKFIFVSTWFKHLKKIYNNDLYFTSSLKGQYTPHILFSSEKIDIGDNQGVRGLARSNIKSDNGVFFRNELIYSINMNNNFLSSFIKQPQIFTSFDIGRFYRNDNSLEKKGSASSVSLGLRNDLGLFTLSSAISKPLKCGKLEKPKGTYFSLSLGIQY